MKYDDASWHCDGEFPDTSPPEYGGVHIGLYLKWCFLQGWAGELHHKECPKALEDVIADRLTGTDFLFEHCDGKFTDEDLNEEGNAFTHAYYGEDGLYLQDFGEHFAEHAYEAPETEFDFERFSNLVGSRRRSGILTKTAEANVKPWWKLW